MNNQTNSLLLNLLMRIMKFFLFKMLDNSIEITTMKLIIPKLIGIFVFCNDIVQHLGLPHIVVF